MGPDRKGLICLPSNLVFTEVISDGFYLGSRKMTPALGNIFKRDKNIRKGSWAVALIQGRNEGL